MSPHLPNSDERLQSYTMLFLRDIFPPLKNALDGIFEVWYLKKYMIFLPKF